ncbi:MAG: DUF1573 domain-containing protein, partial [Candidatus Delongbacteria bacterium]|nr:DUF1573 domain-containing protein [Candidatus Delongbacteria bacterium]
MIDAIWSDPGIHPDFGSAGNGGSYTIGAGNDIYTMGDVVNQGLYAMVQNYGDNTYTYELYHYFGDPAMKIWTANPNDNTITATHNTTIDCAGTTFTVTGSTQDAIATLVFNNELIAQTTLDASGNGTLTYSISEPGSEVALTISKYNHKPYTANLTVNGTCSFPPAVETFSASSVIASTAILNGEITNDYGSVVTESGFVYDTSPDPAIGGTGIIQVQTSPTVTTGSFSENISGLSSKTTYFYRAYAINVNGTSYGDNQSFTTPCSVISTFPYIQDFDSFIASSSGSSCMDSEFEEQECWMNDKLNDQTDWTPVSGSTASSNTGPTGDHTGGGNYLYIEASSCFNHTAYLETPTFDFSGTDYQELSFYYHMYGASMGTLQVDLYYNGTWHNAINADWNGTFATSVSGDQGQEWNRAIVDISEADTYTDVKIRFSGMTGSSYTSDIAIDDVEIYQALPLAYQSSTLTQNTDDVYQGATLQEIIGIQVGTSGSAGTLSLTQFTLNTNGTDNIGDIQNARLFYTDTSNAFKTDNQFGTIIANPNGTFNITGSVDLLSGVNYFWLTYDIASSATIGNVIDAQCTEIIIGGNTETPAITNPTGVVSIVAAPVLSVSTDFLNAIVTECHDSVTHQFTIENTGGKDLSFGIEGDSPGVVELLALTYGVDYSEEYQNTLNAINQYFTNYNLSEVNTTDASILESALSGKDILLISEQESGASSVFSGFESVLQSFVNEGGSVIFCGTSNNSNQHIFNTGLFTGSYGGSVSSGSLNVLNSTHPITDQLPSLIYAQNATYYLNLTDSDAVRLVEYSGTYDIVTYREIGLGKVIFIAYDYYAYDNNAAQIIANTIEWCGSNSLPQWINLSVYTDTIIGGSSQQIDVEFNAKNLNSGIYNTEIIINSNDPVNSTDTITCTFTVDGDPEILVLPSSIDLGDVFTNGTSNDTLLVSNLGCDTLFISNISSSASEFTADTALLEILPGDSAEVIITFTPTSIGSVSGVLTIYNNDADVTIDLIGTGIPAPVLSVSTDFLDAIVTECHDSVTHQFTIENTGGSDLEFDIMGGSGMAFDSTSTQYYSTTDATTNHYFTELSNVSDSIYLIITINGDFDYSSEYVDIYVDGSYVSQINPTLNNTDVTESFALGGSNVANWLSDGQIVVTLDNSSGVNTGYGTMLHQVQLKTLEAEWLNLSIESGTIISGNSTIVDVEFNAKDLNLGIYNTEIIINSNDPVN